jgi:hypothetical protein
VLARISGKSIAAPGGTDKANDALSDGGSNQCLPDAPGFGIRLTGGQWLLGRVGKGSFPASIVAHENDVAVFVDFVHSKIPSPRTIPLENQCLRVIRTTLSTDKKNTKGEGRRQRENRGFLQFGGKMSGFESWRSLGNTFWASWFAIANSLIQLSEVVF